MRSPTERTWSAKNHPFAAQLFGAAGSDFALIPHASGAGQIGLSTPVQLCASSRSALHTMTVRTMSLTRNRWWQKKLCVFWRGPVTR